MPSQSPRPRTEQAVIGIAGRMGAGKTSAARYLSERYGFQYLRYSQVLAEWLATEPEKKTRLQEIGWQVMAGGKQRELNRRLVTQIRPNADAAVDGLRHPIDYESLRDSFADSFRLVYIDSPSELRRSRLRNSGRYGDDGSFRAADSHAVEQQIETLMPNANRVLNNDSTIEALYAELDEVVREFRKEGRA